MPVCALVKSSIEHRRLRAAPRLSPLLVASSTKSPLRKGRATSSQCLPPRSASQYCSQARRKARARILGRSSCPKSVDIELGPRSGDRSEVPDCSRNEDTQPRRNAKSPRLVLMLKLSTDYPQAHSNRAATKHERSGAMPFFPPWPERRRMEFVHAYDLFRGLGECDRVEAERHQPAK